MKQRNLILAVLLVAIIIVATVGAYRFLASPPKPVANARIYEGEVLHVQYWSGSWGDVLTQAIVVPFENETGAKVILSSGGTGASIAKLEAEKDHPTLDIVGLDEIGIYPLVKEKLLQPVDLSQLSEFKNVNQQLAVLGGGYGIAYGTIAHTLMYNTNIFKTPPDSWNVLLDPQYKGKVSINVPTNTFMMFDLVMFSIAKGGNQYTVQDQGFQFLQQVKPSVKLVTANVGQLADLLKTGDLAIVSATSGQFEEYINEGYPIAATLSTKEGVAVMPSGFGIVKNHPGKDAVIHTFLNYVLSKSAQQYIAQKNYVGPVRSDITLPSQVSNQVLDTPAKQQNALRLNLDYLSSNRDQWVVQWNKIMVT